MLLYTIPLVSKLSFSKKSAQKTKWQLIYIIFIIPYKLFKAENKHLPFFLYLKYPFRVLLNDTFDRLSAPIENRYYKEEVISWYKNNNLKVVKILGNGGWRIFGYKV